MTGNRIERPTSDSEQTGAPRQHWTRYRALRGSVRTSDRIEIGSPTELAVDFVTSVVNDRFLRPLSFPTGLFVPQAVNGT